MLQSSRKRETLQPNYFPVSYPATGTVQNSVVENSTLRGLVLPLKLLQDKNNPESCCYTAKNVKDVTEISCL